MSGTSLQSSPPSTPPQFPRLCRVLETIVFAGLLVVIVLVAIPYGTVDMWWEALFECMVFVLTALWIVTVLLRGDWQANRLLMALPMIIITAYVFAQTIVWPGSWLTQGSGPIARHTLTIDPYQTHLTARKALALTLFLSLLLIHTAATKRLRTLVKVIIGLGLASALFGILRQVLQAPDSPGGFVLPFLFYGAGYGQFISANVFAYLIHMALALVAGLVLGGAVPGKQVPFYLAIGVIMFAALVLSNSRGGVLSFVGQSIFVIFIAAKWYSNRRLEQHDRIQSKWLFFIQSPYLFRGLALILILGTLIFGIFWIGGDRLSGKEAFSQEGLEGTSRKEIWAASWQLVKQHPWTGVGFGAYFLAIPEQQIGSGKIKIEYAHNDYLDLAASGGFVAVLLAAWFIGAIIWRTRASMKSADLFRRAAGLGATTGILGVGMHSFVDFGLQITGIAVLFAALLAILSAGLKK